MKKKRILTIFFLGSLLPMLMNQYGGMKGVQEITGLINLCNPIGIAAVILFFSGVWVPFKSPETGTALGGLGVVGMVVSEVYQFFTWHIMTITGKFSFISSVRLVFPEFYIGLIVSMLMIGVYFWIRHRMPDD